MIFYFQLVSYNIKPLLISVLNKIINIKKNRTKKIRRREKEKRQEKKIINIKK